MIPNVGDRTHYITMNLTQPPFDDIHVREAMNYIIDKAALQKACGGPIAGSIATHIVPPVLYNNGLAEYDPYATPNEAGSVAKAAAEMKQSKYDPGHTGKCTASVCKNVLLISDTRSVDKTMAPIIENDAAKIGIHFTIRSINGAYPTIQKPTNNIPISDRSSWGKDYADPYTFFAELFDGGAIIKDGNTNYSLVGITPAMAKTVGATGSVNNVPTVDPQINACGKALGQARTTCWENLDKKLMTQVVPWVPVPLAEQCVHHRSEGHALELRPVLGRPGVLVDLRQAVSRGTTAGGGTRRPAPSDNRTETGDRGMALYIARRLFWTIVVVFCVIAITYAVFYLLPAGDPALRFAGKSPTTAELIATSATGSASTSPGRNSSESSPGTSSSATSTAGLVSATPTRAARSVKSLVVRTGSAHALPDRRRRPCSGSSAGSQSA